MVGLRKQLTHDAYENTWKCGERKLFFSPSAGRYKKKRKKVVHVYTGTLYEYHSAVPGSV